MFPNSPFQSGTSRNVDIITMKLVIDKTSMKVVYAEAEKEFVDFLFSLLQLPFATIMGLVYRKTSPSASASGSLANIYQSVVNLDPKYLQPNIDKEDLLWRHLFSSPKIQLPPLLSNIVEKKRQEENNKLPRRGGWEAERLFAFSSKYDQPSYTASGFMAAATPSKQMGNVKSDKVYLVRDNLMLEPMSYTTSHMLFKDAGSPEEKPVTIDCQKVHSFSVFTIPFV
ncbi:hypothetical protein COLO4_18496 [Corchorus olitorius]|uniref:Uncharacterized protein n=1 Tax=Corchorus olitorius TaxID=93759 RepID=A0A1R3J8U7_9ROSI|nr:hypothetical protein COLO4_18496 [Corchorus olitorius]